MGDECNCDKCGVNTLQVQDAVVWRIGHADNPAEGLGFTRHDMYLVVGRSGIALLQQTAEGSL